MEVSQTPTLVPERTQDEQRSKTTVRAPRRHTERPVVRSVGKLLLPPGAPLAGGWELECK
jgi:hypothetical protein